MEGSDARFSADLGNDFSLGPPDHGPVGRVRDVLICPTVPTPDAPDDVWDHHPPAASSRWERRLGEGAPMTLERSVRLGRLSPDEAELLMHACAPRGHYFVPERQFGQRYSLIREIGPADAEARLA